MGMEINKFLGIFSSVGVGDLLSWPSLQIHERGLRKDRLRGY